MKTISTPTEYRGDTDWATSIGAPEHCKPPDERREYYGGRDHALNPERGQP